MAERHTFIFLGDSLMNGAAYLTLVPSADFTRWTGTTWPTTYPKDVSVDDVLMLTPNLPHGITTQDYAVSGTGTGLTVGTDITFTSASVNQWVYVYSGTGQGQLRKIASFIGAQQVTVSTAWTTSLDTTSLVHYWTDSYAVSGSPSTNVGANTSTITLTGGAALSVNAMAGKWIVIISGTALHYSREIVSNTTSAITVTPALPFLPSAADGLRILTATGTVEDIADYNSTNVSFRPLRFYENGAFSYSTGYEWPNYTSTPLVNPKAFQNTDAINIVPEFTYRARSHFDGPVYGIHMGISATTLAPFPIAAFTAGNSVYWGNEIASADFLANSDNGFYQMILRQLTITKELADASGDTVIVEGVLVNIGTNDALYQAKADQFYYNMKTLRASLRQAIATTFGTVAADRIPWMMAGMGPSAALVGSATIQAALDKLALDDLYTGTFPVTDYPYNPDGIHYTQDGFIEAAGDYYETWLTIKSAEADAAESDEDRPTLASVRTAVLRRYERNADSNDASDTQVNGFINDSLREFYNSVGDNPWFLRRRETLDTVSTYPTTTLLPRHIRRIVRLEDSARPGLMLQNWHAVGLTDNGRLEILLRQCPSGQVVVTHTVIPKDLEGDQDHVLIPQDYLEVIVLMTCKRLAEAAGNQSIASYYMTETDRVMFSVKRNILSFARMGDNQFVTNDAKWHLGDL